MPDGRTFNVGFWQEAAFNTPQANGSKSLRISGACVRNPDMEEPAGPIHWSMGKKGLVWIGWMGADVQACPSAA